MKYVLTWWERPGGSHSDYESAQKRVLGVFQQWQMPPSLSFHQFLVRILADGFQQVRTMVGDPVVHGVTAYQADSVHLAADVALERGLDITQKQVGLRAVRLRKLGIESGEDVEVGDQRCAVVHVVGIDSGPKEGLAGYPFQTLDIDPVGGERVEVWLGEIVTDDADNRDRRKIAGGQGAVGTCAAKDPVDLTVWCLESVISHGTDNYKRHQNSL